MLYILPRQLSNFEDNIYHVIFYRDTEREIYTPEVERHKDSKRFREWEIDTYRYRDTEKERYL